jgi:two-component system, LytTR family, sensor kinase
MELTRDRLLPPILAGLAVWAVASARAAIAASMLGEPAVVAVLVTVPAAIYWLALMPVVLWLGTRLPLRRGRRAASALGHASAAAALAALYAELMVRLYTGWWPEPGTLVSDRVADWAVRFQFGLFTYGFLLSWGYVHEYFTAMRERDLAVARLETELAQAQLRALKAQLQPHFLFNTLHAITVLIRHDADAAGRMVMRLSDLLRMTLVDADRQETTLEHELRFLRLYLEIEQTRFHDRLAVDWQVSPGLARAAVPTLLLQPLVENALRHGIGARSGTGRVLIGASRANGTLVLEVSDDGPGPRAATEAGRGLGLAATRGRLAQLYGDAHRFAFERNDAGGVRVTVGIPYRELEETSHG